MIDYVSMSIFLYSTMLRLFPDNTRSTLTFKTTRSVDASSGLPIPPVHKTHTIEALFDTEGQLVAHAEYDFVGLQSELQKMMDRLYPGEVVDDFRVYNEPEDITISTIMDLSTPMRTPDQPTYGVHLRVKSLVSDNIYHVIKVVFDTKEHAAFHKKNAYAALHDRLHAIFNLYGEHDKLPEKGKYPAISRTNDDLTVGDMLDARSVPQDVPPACRRRSMSQP